VFLHFVTLPQFLIGIALGIGYGLFLVEHEDVQKLFIDVAWSGVLAAVWFSLCIVYNRWTGFIY